MSLWRRWMTRLSAEPTEPPAPLAWDALARVTIVTTDQGPFLCWQAPE